MTAPAIRLRELCVRFGDFTAVDDLSLEVAPGELFGFLGPNGAGKTTTIKVLTGSLAPTHGSAEITGRRLPHDLGALKAGFGYVPDTENHFEEFTGRENLLLFARLYGVPRERAEAALERLELEEAADLRVKNYSKGMKKKLLIARETLHEPRILYCDEPTANLDAHSVEMVRGILRELASAGTTVFMTTHNMKEVEEICDRVAILCRGRLIDCDSPTAFVLRHAERRVAVEYSRDGRTERELLDLANPEQRGRLGRIVATEDDLRVHSQEFDFAQVFLKLTGEAYA